MLIAMNISLKAQSHEMKKKVHKSIHFSVKFDAKVNNLGNIYMAVAQIDRICSSVDIGLPK